MSKNNPISFESGKARETSVDGFSTIQDFRRSYYQRVFEGALPFDIADYVNGTTIMNWRKQSMPKQSFADAFVTAAFRDDENGGSSYEGHVYSASNVSSRDGGLIGATERAIKLFAPYGPASGYCYFAIRELIGTSTEVIDGLLESAVKRAKDLPIKAYVFEAEEMVIDVLLKHGMTRDPSFPVLEGEFRSTTLEHPIALHCYRPDEEMNVW